MRISWPRNRKHYLFYSSPINLPPWIINTERVSTKKCHQYPSRSVDLLFYFFPVFPQVKRESACSLDPSTTSTQPLNSFYRQETTNINHLKNSNTIENIYISGLVIVSLLSVTPESRVGSIWWIFLISHRRRWRREDDKSGVKSGMRIILSRIREWRREKINVICIRNRSLARVKMVKNWCAWSKFFF